MDTTLHPASNDVIRRRLVDPVRRHRLATFYVLAYAFTWALLPIGTFLATGPLLAALCVSVVADGWAGLRALASRLLRWRVAWPWYVVAIGVPAVVHTACVALNLALGADATSLAIGSVSSVAAVFALRLIDPTNGPMGEEPGWRAFALPGLQAQASPLASTVILAALVTGWHVPLVLLPAFHFPAVALLSTAAVTVWYAWLFNRSGGSALLTLIAHAAEGSVAATGLWIAAVDAARAEWIYALAWCVVAGGLLLVDRRAWSASGLGDAERGRTGIRAEIGRRRSAVTH